MLEKVCVRQVVITHLSVCVVPMEAAAQATALDGLGDGVVPCIRFRFRV